jgi:hypothetical protein
MIDPLETIIAYFKWAGLSTTQIASKDRYGEAWAIPSAGVVVNLDGGDPEVYLPVQTPRIEVRCYGVDRPAAMSLLMEIIALSRSTMREAVAVSGGNEGLLYYFNQASGTSMLHDSELGMDFAMMFFEASIAETGV